MIRPHVVTHVMVSVDGRLGGFTPDVGLYFELAGQLPHVAVLTGSGTLVAAAEDEGIDLAGEDEPHWTIEARRSTGRSWSSSTALVRCPVRLASCGRAVVGLPGVGECGDSGVPSRSSRTRRRRVRVAWCRARRTGDVVGPFIQDDSQLLKLLANGRLLSQRRPHTRSMTSMAVRDWMDANTCRRSD